MEFYQCSNIIWFYEAWNENKMMGVVTRDLSSKIFLFISSHFFEKMLQHLPLGFLKMKQIFLWIIILKLNLQLFLSVNSVSVANFALAVKNIPNWNLLSQNLFKIEKPLEKMQLWKLVTLASQRCHFGPQEMSLYHEIMLNHPFQIVIIIQINWTTLSLTRLWMASSEYPSMSLNISSECCPKAGGGNLGQFSDSENFTAGPTFSKISS